MLKQSSSMDNLILFNRTHLWRGPFSSYAKIPQVLFGITGCRGDSLAPEAAGLAQKLQKESSVKETKGQLYNANHAPTTLWLVIRLILGATDNRGGRFGPTEPFCRLSTQRGPNNSDTLSLPTRIQKISCYLSHASSKPLRVLLCRSRAVSKAFIRSTNEDLLRLWQIHVSPLVEIVGKSTHTAKEQSGRPDRCSTPMVFVQ